MSRMPSKRKNEISPQLEKKKSKTKTNSQEEFHDSHSDEEELMDDDEEARIITDTSPVKQAIKSPLLEVVIFEVYRVNDKPFEDKLSRIDVKSVWKEATGRDTSEIKQLSINRISGRCFQITFRLKTPTRIVDISTKAEFEVEKCGPLGIDIYKVKLPDHADVECALGKITTVIIYGTIKLDIQDIGSWLELYGKIKGKFRYKSLLCIQINLLLEYPHKSRIAQKEKVVFKRKKAKSLLEQKTKVTQVQNKSHSSARSFTNISLTIERLKLVIYLISFSIYRVTVDEEGIEYDELEVDIVFSQQMPEVLPIKGQRIKVYYPGIKPLCTNCYKSGHRKWECEEQEKTNWLAYVYDFYKSKSITHDMLGEWVNVLKKFHPELQPTKPIWSQETTDLRSNLDSHYAQTRNPDRNQVQVNQEVRGRGRGRGRARGRGRQSVNKQYQDSQEQTHFHPQSSQQDHQEYPNPNYQRGRGTPARRARARGGRNSQQSYPRGYANKKGKFY